MVDNTDPFTGVAPFLRVAETLSFRRAAESLGVTPAAVSRTIRRLEERVGTRLLERTTRSVRLTSEGAQFASRCREALAQMRIAESELSIARGVPQGTLTISSSQILAPLLTPALSRFLLRHPTVRADVRFSDRVVRFADEDVDVALRVGSVEDQDVVAHVLLRPRWMLVASPAYLARKGTPRTPEDLAGHACVRFIPPRARPRPWVLDGRAIVVGGPLDVDRGDVLVTAALSDAGIARVLDFMVGAEVRDRRLVEVLPEADGGRSAVSAVHATSRRSVPRVRAFLAFLRDELGR
ncbi:MAG: LysR family transcriptional regulator [Labilithrix sp.]|nr:LysR family transcriptional regulator [Labilithrix sp.]